MPNDFQTAYQRANERIGESGWMKLSVTTQANMIYAELRTLDAERVAEQAGRTVSRCLTAIKPLLIDFQPPAYMVR